MIPENTSALLKYPFYKIYYLDDIERYKGMSDSEIAAFEDEYDVNLRNEIVEALKWVREHPASDLTKVLPNLPCSNDAIHHFAHKILNSLEK